MWGQSNLGGRAEPPYYACTEEGLWNWNESTQGWGALEDPFAHHSFNGNAALGSMAPRLGDYLRANAWGDNIGFIPVSQGGTRSDEYLPGNPLFTSAVAETTAALAEIPGSTLEGVVIYQGESDTISSAPSPVEWYDNWLAAIAALEDELGLGADTLRVLLVLLPVTAPDRPAYTQAKWDETRDAISALAATRPNTWIVQSPPTPGDPGDVDVHHDMGADDTEGFRKLAVDVGAEIVADWV